jgi:hypothetical protein
LPTDKQRAKKVERATEGALRWLGFLQQHELTIGFVDKFEDQPDDEQPDCRSISGYPYCWVRFIWRRHVVDHGSDELLERMAIHEALHVLLFSPLDHFLQTNRTKRPLEEYDIHQERIVDLVTHYIDRRRPRYGYHPSGVPNTHQSAKEKTKRSTR